MKNIKPIHLAVFAVAISFAAHAEHLSSTLTTPLSSSLGDLPPLGVSDSSSPGPAVPTLTDTRFEPKPAAPAGGSGKYGPSRKLQFSSINNINPGPQLKIISTKSDGSIEVESETGKVLVGTPLSDDKLKAILSNSKLGKADDKSVTPEMAYGDAAKNIVGYQFVEKDTGKPSTGKDLGLGQSSVDKANNEDWYFATRKLDQTRSTMARQNITNTLVMPSGNGQLSLVGGGGGGGDDM